MTVLSGVESFSRTSGSPLSVRGGVGLVLVLLGIAISRVDVPVYLLAAAVLGAVSVSAATVIARRYGSAQLLTPSMAACALALASTVLVPISWAAGLATPWSEVEGAENSAVLWGLLFTTALIVGVAAARPWQPSGGTSVRYAARNPDRSLLVSMGIGAGALALLLALVGGPNAALAALNVRRTFFAGFAPLLGVALVPGVALVFYAASSKSAAKVLTRLLILGALALYAAAVFFTGNKSHIVVLLVMLAVARARSGRVRLAAVLVAALVFVPLSTLYHYKIRQERSLGVSEGQLSTASATDFARTAWQPFAASGLDHVRTIWVVARDGEYFRFRPGPLLAAPATVVPRAIWPSKPDAADLEFAKTYFPRQWATGTGVPPALAAEFAWEFGLIGGFVMYMAFGFAIGVADRRLRASSNSLAHASYPLFTAAILITTKAGSDSGLRLFFLFFSATVVCHMVWRSR